MKLGFSIALRFLKSTRGQTILITLGIAIGVSVQIFIGSLIQGLQKGLVEKTIGNQSHITIKSDGDDALFNNYEDIMAKVKSTDKKIKAVSASYDNPVFLSMDDNTSSLVLRGFDLDNADKIYNINDRIIEGKYPDGKNEVILGSDLKEELGLSLNQTINIVTPSKENIDFKVVGFFDFKVVALNKTWALTTLETSQSIFNKSGYVNSIEIQVAEDSVFLADEIGDKIKSKINDDDLKVDNWKEQNEQLLSGLNGQSVSSIMIQVFVMISVVLGIASVLAITVMQKSKQIGILKAMGIKNGQASYIFLFEGLILGLLGAILGVIFGLLLSYAFTKFALNPDGTPVIDLYIDAKFIAISGLIAVSASVLASLIPAVKSRKLDPIDVIRNN